METMDHIREAAPQALETVDGPFGLSAADYERIAKKVNNFTTVREATPFIQGVIKHLDGMQFDPSGRDSYALNDKNDWLIAAFSPQTQPKIKDCDVPVENICDISDNEKAALIRSLGRTAGNEVLVVGALSGILCSRQPANGHDNQVAANGNSDADFYLNAVAEFSQLLVRAYNSPTVPKAKLKKSVSTALERLRQFTIGGG